MNTSQEAAVKAGLAPSKERLTEVAAQMAPYRQAIIDDLKLLCSVPSVRGEAQADAPYGQDTVEALRVFLKRGEELGFRSRSVDNEAGYLEWGSGDKMIALVCHLDVVPAGDGWEYDPFVLREEDSCLIGRGTADDKGPLVAGLYGIKALMDQGYEPPCRIRVIVGLNEENGSSCMRHYTKMEEHPVAGFTADASFPAIYAEKGHLNFRLRLKRTLKGQGLELMKAHGGSAFNMVAPSCTVTLSQDGTILEELKVEGKAAHASTPQNGENAIQKAMQLMLERGVEDVLCDFFQAVLGMEYHGQSMGVACEDESGVLTLNVGLLELNEKEANIGIDIRYPIFANGSEILAKIQKKAAEFAFEMYDELDSLPLNLGKDSEMVQTLMKVYNDLCGTKAEAIAIGGGTYARACPNILAYGMMFPGDPDCMHQVNEKVEIDRLLASATIYREAIKALADLQA